jgi:ribonuclease P protein component
MRLACPAEFSRVFDGAEHKRHATGFFILARSNDKSHCRLGMVISRRNCKRASMRHRFKRHIREQFRLHQHRLPPLDIVVVAKPALSSLELHDFPHYFNTVLMKLS